MVEVCKYMGWDFHTYEAQPVWFIETVIERIKAEAESANSAHKQNHG